MAADLEHLPDFATVPLLVVASPLIFIVIAELHLAADLAGREFHRMDIDVNWQGDRLNRVPTPPGTREPQNRRVEMLVN